MACVYSIDGGKNYLTESDFKNYLKNNLEDLVNGKDIDLSKFSNVVPKSKVSEVSKPTNQEELATMLEKKFGRNPMLAQAEAKLFDLRAEVWSRLTGNSKQDFYDRVSYGQEKSDEGLNQMTLPNGSTAMVKPINAEVVNGFYSPLEKIINDVKQDKLPAKQWIEKFARGEEAKWTGLTEWLSQQQGSVSKADIQKYLKDNRIEIVEVVHDENTKSPHLKRFDDIIDILRSRGYDVEIENYGNSEMMLIGVDDGTTFLSEENGGYTNNELIENGYTLKKTHDEDVRLFEEAQKEVKKISNLQQRENNLTPTKFHQYQLEGEKENYKEVLVTLPKKVSIGADLSKVKEVNSPKGKYLYDSTYFNSIEEIKDYDGDRREEEPTKFKSSHFPEPNILVHLRMNTRTDAEGNKVLFLEEVQSDWGQKGKKEGFDNKQLEAKRNELLDKMYALELEHQSYTKRTKVANTGNVSDYRLESTNEKRQKEIEAEVGKLDAEVKKINAQTGITPEAPFVTDTNAWTKLGLKVALKEAVAQGADKIAWTTGEQQNERYDLSKQADEIQYNDNGDGTYNYSAIKNGKEIGSKENADLKTIEAELGKDVANRMANSLGEDVESDIEEVKSLTGENLSVGGKGMKGFYGSPTEGSLGIVGNVAKSLTKQEPKTVEIEVSNSQVDLDTPPRITKLSSGEYVVQTPFKDSYVMVDGEMENPTFKDLSSANEFYINETDRYNKEIEKPKTSTQHSIDITPELKAEVEKGQPLFQKQKGTTRGQIKFTDKVKGFNNAVMSLFKTAKADTFVHEFSHLNFQDMLAMANDNEQIKADVKTAIEFFNQHAKPSERIKNVDEAVEHLLGIDPANHLRDDTYVKVHEAFANGFTEYLRNPNSNIPTALKEIYEVLKNYLADLAQYIAGSQAKLTPEMEAVYRRLFEPEFVNNIKETAENRSVEREAIEMEQPIVRYNDDIAKDAFSSFDTLEQGDRPTPNQIFKSKIEEWKKEGKTDSTFVMEQLNQFIEDIAPEENKKILKDFIKTKRAEYEELADGKKNLRQRTRTLLENKGLSLDDKERLFQDDTAATYVKISFKELQKDVDEVIGNLTYDEVVQSEEAILDRIEETTDPKGLPYAIADYQAKKLKKGFDYLDELRRNPKKNAKEIVELENKLHKDLATQLERSTAAGRELAAQKFFDILTPQILVENIKRQQEAKRTEAQNAKLKEEVEILKEKVEKGVANEEIHQAIVDELEAKVEVLQERLTDYDKQISKLEAKIKEEKDQSKQSVIENLKERALGKTKNSKTLKVDKQEKSDNKSKLKSKLKSFFDSNLYSEDNSESPLQVLQEYIENHILEQQSELAKKVSLSDMIKHLEEEGLPIPPATIAEAYKKARVRLIQEGVNRRAIDADATIDLTLEALEAKKDIEVLKAEKKALQNKIKNGASSVDKLIAEAVKGVKWKDRVVNYNRDAAEKEVVDKVIQNNPDLSDAEKQAVEQRVKDLFREKTEQWTANQINRVEKKGQPKKKREISNNIAKLSNLISTGNFNQGVNEALAEELGLAGITDEQRTQITSRMDVIKSLRHGTLRDFAIEDLSAYIMSITNPQMFAHNIWTSTVYTEMLSNIVSSAQNATGLIVSFDKAITDTILNLDSTYLKNFFAAFNKGMLRSALQKGYFKSNEHFDLAQSEGGFSPFRGSEYAGKYGKNLDSKRRRFLAKYRSIKTTYLGGKFITRLNEGVDNISYASASESAAYKHIKKVVKRENPNATKEEIENMVYERMFPIKPSEAREMAIKDLNESALTLSFKAIPTESEINRVSFDIMQQARDEDTKEIMERESLKGTYRNKPSAFNKGGGVVEGFSAAYEWAMSGAKNSIKNSKLNQSAKNKWMTALNISKILTLPFSRTPANIIEIGTHYAVLGGVAKIASLQAYKKGLKGTQGISVEAEREYITQYQKDVAVRMAKGAALLTILPVVFAMLNDDKDDDELQDGVYGNSKNNPTKIKNSIVIGGKIIPLNFLGALAPLLAVLGAKSDLERDKKYTDVSDESIKNDIHGIDNYVEATKNWMFSVVKSTPFYGSSRTVESISDFLNDKKTEGLGKMIGTQLAYSYLPSPRMINDVISWEYTKAPEPHGFVQGMIRGTYTPALIAMGVSKPMFDNRGREVDIRDKSFMSVGGVYKRLASEPNDKYDNILLNHKIMLPFMKADSYLKNGRELTPDEFYKFSKGVADKYNQMITNTSSIPKVYYIENEDGEVKEVNVHGLKYTLNQIKAYKNMSIDELEKIGSADLQADRELYKAIMDNYKTIIKQQMHTMRIEKNSYSNYEDRMLSEYEKEKLEKNKKELRYNLKKP